MQKKWNIKKPDSELIHTISSSLNIFPLVAQVLINRGINTPEKADFFLSADLGHLHSPFLMKDMHRAVERVRSAVAKKEKICIFGDYDVDGITATSVMVLFLRHVRADVSFYIPDREQGYGLNIESIKKTFNPLLDAENYGWTMVDMKKE